MNFKANYLSSLEGTAKKSGKAYWMMTVLFTVYEGNKVVQSYCTNLFLTKEEYGFVKNLAPMQELDLVFLPTNRGIQIIQLDIAG